MLVLLRNLMGPAFPTATNAASVALVSPPAGGPLTSGQRGTERCVEDFGIFLSVERLFQPGMHWNKMRSVLLPACLHFERRKSAMIHKLLLNISAFGILISSAAVAQTDGQAMTEEEMTAADEAAETMYVEIYGDAAPTYVTVSEAIDRMEAMGYTNIHEFDVEWGHYEVEANAPDGNEVEIEFDPVTGAILEIEDNWF